MPTLFSQPESDGTSERPVLSVSELVGALKAHVEDGFSDVWIEGELSNFHRARSGHCYFTIKDADAQIRCVMWKHLTQYVFFEPEDGMHVRLQGSPSIYEQRGRLQIQVRAMKLAGEGALQKAFEELKRRLRQEGLFDEAHKQPLPAYPEHIGIVTSGTSAALQDMLTVLGRRFPCVEVTLASVPVQGMDAARAIAGAVRAFNALPARDGRPDLLILGRGGGSSEDLWAFNEEPVARALHASEIPTISGVGHETDVSIADFTADVRAATPSMAAELAVPDGRETEALVQSLYERLHSCITGLIEDGCRRAERLTRSRAFHRPVDRLRQHQQHLDGLVRRLQREGRQLTRSQKERLEALRHRLRATDPERPLQRGYSLVEKDGAPVREAAALTPGDCVTLHFQDGRHEAVVSESSQKGKNR